MKITSIHTYRRFWTSRPDEQYSIELHYKCTLEEKLEFQKLMTNVTRTLTEKLDQ